MKTSLGPHVKCHFFTTYSYLKTVPLILIIWFVTNNPLSTPHFEDKNNFLTKPRNRKRKFREIILVCVKTWYLKHLNKVSMQKPRDIYQALKQIHQAVEQIARPTLSLSLCLCMCVCMSWNLKTLRMLIIRRKSQLVKGKIKAIGKACVAPRRTFSVGAPLMIHYGSHISGSSCCCSWGCARDYAFDTLGCPRPLPLYLLLLHNLQPVVYSEARPQMSGSFFTYLSFSFPACVKLSSSVSSRQYWYTCVR